MSLQGIKYYKGLDIRLFYQYKFVMGPTPSRQLISPEQDGFSSRFTYIRNKGDASFYIENITSKEFASKIVVCDTPQEQANFFADVEKTALLTHDNIISIQKVYSLQARSCGTVASKYMILFPYAFRNIRDERDERLVLNENFTEPQLWSILLSVCRTLEFLQSKSLPFTPITSQQILIDKEGLIQLDAHHLVQHPLFEDNYVSRNKKLRYASPQCKGNRVNYGNLRDVEKQNIFSLGIVLLELMEMRDLVELQEDRGGEKQILQLLINRSTYVSSQLRQIIRRLTDETKQGRPTYRDVIDFIENQEEMSGVLYYQNQIPTAKKPTHIPHNSLNFDGFDGRSSLNAQVDLPINPPPSNAYAIPSFSYNNIREGIRVSKARESMRDTQAPIIYQQTNNKMSYHSDMVENSTGLHNPSLHEEPAPNFYQSVPQATNVSYVPITGSVVQTQKTKMVSTGNFSPIKQSSDYTFPPINSLNFPREVSPTEVTNKGLKPQLSESPSAIKQIQSNISPIDSNLKLGRATGVADDIKLISPKPSLFSRESNFGSVRKQTRHNFSKTGSIEGFNKIYNDNPEYCYQKIDYKDLNNIGGLWLYYQGNFKDGKRFGPGVIYMSNGEKFEGNFINDLAEGRGKYSTLDWKDVEGIWRNGCLISIV